MITTQIFKNGIVNLFKKFAQKSYRLLFYTTCSTWYVREIDETVSGVMPCIEAEACFLNGDKTIIIEWLKFHHRLHPWIFCTKEIDCANENDHVFVVLKDQGNIFGYVKVGRGSTYIGDFDKTVVFEPKTAFIYDTFILPEYRGKNLSVFLMDEVVRYLKNQKLERILCHIEKWNTPSIRIFRKASFHAFGSIRFVRIVFFSFFIRNGLLPFLNLEKHLRTHGVHKGK